MKARYDLIKKGIPANAGMASFKKGGSLVRSAQTRIGQAPVLYSDWLRNRINRQPGRPVFADLNLSLALALIKKTAQISADLSAREGKKGLSICSKYRPLKPAPAGHYTNGVFTGSNKGGQF